MKCKFILVIAQLFSISLLTTIVYSQESSNRDSEIVSTFFDHPLVPTPIQRKLKNTLKTAFLNSPLKLKPVQKSYFQGIIDFLKSFFLSPATEYSISENCQN